MPLFLMNPICSFSPPRTRRTTRPPLSFSPVMTKRRFSDDENDGSAGNGDRKEEGKLENTREHGAEFEASGGGGANDGLEVEEPAKPFGMPVRVSGKGRNRKLHFESFEYYGNVYKLNDNVLLSPENVKEKPYIAIIKDITQDVNGSVMVTGQWFYRPEEAAKEGGATWRGRDTREIYFSFHIDEFAAESVMHKCIIHFIPMHKQLPIRTEYPGFIVQKFYDIHQKKLWKLNDYELDDDVKREITRLVNETRKHLGELPDIVEDAPAIVKDKGKCQLRSLATFPPSALRRGMTVTTSHPIKADSPSASISDVSKYLNILVKFNAKTGYTHRDKWLAKLLQGIEPSCNLKEDQSVENRTNEIANGFGRICWPDTAVSAIVALEKASFEAFPSDFHKYNQKMRQLDFNLKNKGVLARRLLNKELDPVVIINMLPNELKDGLTAEEKTSKEPDVSKKMQMTDARCSRCMEKKVGVAGIIQTAGHMDRYQLDCNSCGHTWYALRDAIPFFTTDSPTNAAKPNRAPPATVKHVDGKRKLIL